jgi:hypothetical protein
MTGVMRYEGTIIWVECERESDPWTRNVLQILRQRIFRSHLPVLSGDTGHKRPYVRCHKTQNFVLRYSKISVQTM